jgi:pheromone shutdown protein TraB
MISWLRRKIRRALAREEWSQSGKLKKLQRVQKYPNEILVLGMMFALLALICLTVLETVYIIVFRQWSTEIFAGIMSTITFILGAIFGAKT